MKENYTYAAVFDYSEEGFVGIEFPMFDGPITAYTCADKTESPIEMAQDVLALAIVSCEDDGIELPDENIKPVPEENQEIVYINVWLPYHRSRIKETYTKKTLTIPVWLEQLAKERHLNFSAVLVKALKQELGIS